jgi:hypothetical protein
MVFSPRRNPLEKEMKKNVQATRHGSDSPDKKTAAVRLYLDESGGDDPGTPHAVVGGVLINYSYFLHFEEEWDRMLETHGFTPPIHMKEFGPHGRFADISPCCRRELFLEIVELINSHKIASIAATLSNEEYKANIDEKVRDEFSVYGMCFILSVVMNHKLAVHKSYGERIPFILDTGNPHKGHVVSAHAAMIEWQKESFLHVGGLHFEDDKDFGILQAADVVAWGVRRRTTGKPFGYAFEPIRDILNKQEGHGEADWKAEWLKEMSEGVMKRYLEAKAKADEAKNE